MLNFIKNIFNKKKFNRVCDSAQLKLDYKLNKVATSILHDIFIQREYADYFPFYEQATIVDIGAHFGYFSIFAARNSKASSTIYAIEPSPSNYQILTSNLKSSTITNVHPLQMAISDRVGDLQLFEGDSYNHSLIENYSLSHVEAHKTIVKTLDLATFIKNNNIQKIDFLKMDCEGAEYSIIFNASREVMDKIQVISMEFHDLKDETQTPNRLREKLISDGFSIVKFEYKPTGLNLNYGKLIAIK